MPLARLDISPKAIDAYQPKFSTYAIIRRDVAADGRTTALTIRAGTPELLKLIEAAHPEAPMKPATRNGRPIDSRFRITLIWDVAPSSSGSHPRLLQVTRPWVGNAPPSRVAGVPIIVHVDRLGNATRISGKFESAPIGDAIRASVLQWAFAPALRSNKAVESDLALTVVPDPDGTMPEDVVTPPRLLEATFPDYPTALVRAQIQGIVHVSFVVDKVGQVTRATVVSSSNPSFDENALAAIRQWKFRPAELNGDPVDRVAQMPVIFVPQRGAHDQYRVTGGDPSKLGYDVGPRITSVALTNYPFAMIQAEKTGSAAVNIGIDADGSVAAIGGVAGSTPEFARALVAAAEEFRFRPATLKGKPVPCVLHYTADFDWALGTPWFPDLTARDDRNLLRTLTRHPEWIVPSAQLDTPPKIITQRNVQYPVNWKSSHPEGTARIEVTVDPEGRARLPRILASSQEEFGYAAVQAAQYWRFEKPQFHGKAVYTRIVLPFRFQLLPAPAR